MYGTIVVSVDDAIGPVLDYILAGCHKMRIIRQASYFMVLAEDTVGKHISGKHGWITVGHIPLPGFKPDDAIGVPRLDHENRPDLWFPMVSEDQTICTRYENLTSVFSKDLLDVVKHKSEAVARLRAHLRIQGIETYEVPAELAGPQ